MAAVEGRAIGFEGLLGELRAGRLPWWGVRDLLRGQWAQLEAEPRGWLAALLAGTPADAWLSSAEAAALWGVEEAVAGRRLWLGQGQGLVETDGVRWRVAPVVRLALGGDGQRGAG